MKGRIEGGRSVVKPPKPQTSEPSASAGTKFSSEGPTPAAKKGKGKVYDDSDSEMMTEVNRFVAMGELERLSSWLGRTER